MLQCSPGAGKDIIARKWTRYKKKQLLPNSKLRPGRKEFKKQKLRRPNAIPLFIVILFTLEWNWA